MKRQYEGYQNYPQQQSYDQYNTSQSYNNKGKRNKADYQQGQRGWSTSDGGGNWNYNTQNYDNSGKGYGNNSGQSYNYGQQNDNYVNQNYSYGNNDGRNYSYGNNGGQNYNYASGGQRYDNQGQQNYDYGNQGQGYQSYDYAHQSYDDQNQSYDKNYNANQNYDEGQNYENQQSNEYYNKNPYENDFRESEEGNYSEYQQHDQYYDKYQEDCGYSGGNNHYPSRHGHELRYGPPTVDPEEDLLRFNLQVISDKLKEINPNVAKRDLTSKLVTVTMMVLNNCATHISQEETKYPIKPEPVLEEDATLAEVQVKKEIIDEETPMVEPEQILLGVIRTGLAKKKLILESTVGIGDELIVLTKNKPTKPLVDKVLEYLKLHINIKLKDSVNEAIVSLLPDHSIEISYNLPDPHLTVIIRFTSPQYSPDLAEEYRLTCETSDILLLNEADCVNDLAKIRQMRWFDNEICLRLEAPIIRLILSLSHKIDQFKWLNVDAIQVLVSNATRHLGDEANRYSLFVHVLKVLSGGILLPAGRGLKCSWDRNRDACDAISLQERENITLGAQQALRMVLIYGVEKLLF